MQCMEVWGGNRGIDTGVEVPGLEGWVLARPHAGAEAGGDIHYVSSCATGRITRLLLADVSGHGSGVDAVAVELRNLMRRYVNMIDQRALVRSLNREFGELARDGMFATAVAATYFAPARRLVISNAGHPRPLVFRAREQTWSSIGIESAGEDGPANLPLGVLAPTSYDERAIALVEGDFVVFYSDSLIEARNAQGKTLGEEGLRHRLGAIKPGTPEQVARSIVQGLDGLADDDVTLMVLRVNASRVRRGAWSTLVGSVDFARLVWRRLLRGPGEPIPWPEWSGANVLGFFSDRLSRAFTPKEGGR